MRFRPFMILAAGALIGSCSAAGASLPETTASTPAVATIPPVTTTVAALAPAAIVPPTDEPTTVAAVPLSDRPSVGQVGEGCTDKGRSAVVDRKIQRAWLCKDGRVTALFPITTAKDQPDPGHYKVYAKDLRAYSSAGGHWSTMTHFVAFTRGKYTGARVAFHSLPTLRSGAYAQPPESVGDPAERGASAGCIRALYDDAVLIWDTLRIGDAVVVIS